MVDFRKGDRVNNRYEIVRRLGAGAMGCVYEALDCVENNLRVALKVLFAESLEDQDAWAKGEYEALTRLRHPNLARVFDFGRVQGSPDFYIVTEFIKGTDLYAATEYSSPEEICDLVVQVCRALEYIHSQGYVHFDIKPDNILVTRHRCATIRDGSKVQWVPREHRPESGRYEKPSAKLIDFGLAEKISGSFDFAIKGTLNYLAPEMINGGTPDRRADLYSLGVTFYQVVNRDLPFHHEQTSASRRLKRSELFELHMKKLPEYLRNVIMKLLAERPEQRFQSAKEVIEALSEGSARHYELETKETQLSYLHCAVLVGRQQELCELKEYGRSVFPQVRDRLGSSAASRVRPPLILITGEIGAGKSRLVEEFRHFLRLNYVNVYSGNCYDGQNKAYQPFGEALRQLGVYLGRENDLFQRYRDALLRLLPEFKTPGDVERPLGFRPDQEKLYFIDRIVRFIVEVAREEPYTLILNNLHWADEMSVELLGYLLQNIVEEDAGTPDSPLGLLLIGTLRTDERMPASLRQLITSLREDGRVVEIHLRRLKLPRVRELIRSTLHLTTIPDEFIQCIGEKTGGNPLFVLETLKSLQESGVIRPGASGWEVILHHLRRINLPTSVELALLERLTYLDPQARALVEIMAVAKRPLGLEVLEKWPGLGSGTVLPQLRALQEKGFLCSEVVDGREQFCLDQPSFGDIIYRNLPEERRKELHGTFASVLQELFADREDEVLEDLAQHWRCSGDEARGLELSLRAGERLKKIYATEKAYECYCYAVEVLSERGPKDPAWQSSHEALAELCIALGKYEEALRLLEVLLNAGTAQGASPGTIARYLRSCGKVFEIQGDYEHALPCYKQAREQFTEEENLGAEDDLERILSVNALAGLYVRMGKYEKAMRICIEALRIIEGVNETIQHAAVFTTIGLANYYRGNVAQSIEFHRRSLEIEEKLGDSSESVLSLNHLGETYLALAQYAEAYRCFSLAAERSEELGDPYGRAVSLHGLGTFYLAVGATEKSRRAQQQSLRLSRTYHMRQLSNRNYVLQGMIHYQEGELSKAEGSFLRALTTYSKQGNKWELCWLLLRSAAVYRERGHLEHTGQALEDAKQLCDDLGNKRLQVEWAIAAAQLRRALERDREGVEILQEAAGLLEAVNNPEVAARLYGELGDALARCRRVTEARQAYEQAASKARQVLECVPAEFNRSYAGLYETYLRSFSEDEQLCEGPQPDGSSPEGIREPQSYLTFVTELAAGVASGQCDSDMAREMLVLLTQQLQAQYGFLLVRESEEELRVFQTSDQKGSPVEHPSSHIAEELIAMVLEQGQPLCCATTAADPTLKNLDSVVVHNLRSALVVPLRNGEETAGVLYVANPSAPGEQERWEQIAGAFVPLLTLVVCNLYAHQH